MTQGERTGSRPEMVFTQLLIDIVTGVYETGASLPSERALSEQLNLSRSVVREALQRLAQLGLVQTQHGGSTRTTDFRRSAGLDLLTTLATAAPMHQQAPVWWLSLMDMRAALGADAARLCALRASRVVRERILSTAQHMAESPRMEELVELEVTFWDHVLEGADNIAYRLAYNTLMKVRPYAATAQQLSFLEVKESGYRLPLANAIVAGDAAAAEAEAKKSLRKTAEQLSAALGGAAAQAAATAKKKRP